MKIKLFMPAFTREDAEALVEAGHGWTCREAAQSHLEQIRKPPTDSWYASQYRIFTVVVESAE